MPGPDLALVERPPHIDKNDPRYFTIKSGAVKAITVKSATEGAPDEMFIEGTASSSVTDRYGDDLDVVCQARMVDQAKGLTMWLNHSYKIPEDILGTNTEAHLEAGEDPEFGHCIDLSIRVRVHEGNPRAVAAWQAVQRGVQLGFSIGAIFTDFDFKNEDDWWDWTVIVHDLDLLEISLVGIPANPRAYTKSIGDGGSVAPGELRSYVNQPTRKLHEAIGERMKQAGDGARTPDYRLAVKKSILAGAGAPEEATLELKGITAADVEAAASAAGIEPALLRTHLGAKLRDGSITIEQLGEAAAAAKAAASEKPLISEIKAAAEARGVKQVDGVFARLEAQIEANLVPQEELAAAIEAELIAEKASEPIETAPTTEETVADVPPPAEEVATGDTTAAIVLSFIADDKKTAVPFTLSGDNTVLALSAADVATLTAAGVTNLGLPYELSDGVKLYSVPTAALSTAAAGIVAAKAAGEADNDLSDDQLALVVKAMQGIRKGYDRVHECYESMGHARGAHMALKELLPDTYDTPADAELPDEADQPTVERAYDALVAAGVVSAEAVRESVVATLREALKDTSHGNVVKLQLSDEFKAFVAERSAALVEQVEASIPQELRDAVAELEAKRDALTAEISTSTQQRDTLTTEVETLTTKAEELRATPTGRQSAQPGGSKKETGSEPLASADMYHKTVDQLMADANARRRASGDDARSGAA